MFADGYIHLLDSNRFQASNGFLIGDQELSAIESSKGWIMAWQAASSSEAWGAQLNSAIQVVQETVEASCDLLIQHLPIPYLCWFVTGLSLPS